MIKKLLLFFLFFSSFIGFSQKDTLLDLNFNSRIITERNKEFLNQTSLLRPSTIENNYKKKASTLPFFDDFSQYYYYPDGSKWEDINVYINNNFAVNPISYGVATFDGLDSTGYPYDFIHPTAQGVADYLTSTTIDLSSVTDSVYLSFYYQPQGNGNKPEANDSLRVEFYRSSDSTWVRQWAVEGSALSSFKLAMIPIDTSFHKSDFKFRFKNYATLSGNLDHWNVDYVYLNDQRTYNDTSFFDVAITRDFYNFLNEYSRMPWQHYMKDTISNMSSNIDVEYRNNTSSSPDVFYKYEVKSDNGTGSLIELYPSTNSSKPIPPYSSLIEPQAVNSSPLNNFYFPGDDTARSKVFQIKNYFSIDQGSTPDSVSQNDTIVTYQVFGNDYAYDDGSAELGYGVFGIDAKLAHQFNFKNADTLTGIKIYFSPIRDNYAAKTFKLTIWSSLSPEVIIYQQSAYYSPIYTSTNEFYTYDLEYPIYLPAGTYYVGWQQIFEEYLNVGWDVNSDHSSKVFFNTGAIWESPSFTGTLMIRPTFSGYPEPIVNINEKDKLNDINVYPIPAKNTIQISSSIPYNIKMFDVFGKIILQKNNLQPNEVIDVSSLKSGIYFIKFFDKKSIISKKIIISK